ncbi:MAG: hypothetical protein IJ941_02780, partial [Clostridia bacterium]|nr:hypothetical protein [Clostridia bacterium]
LLTIQSGLGVEVLAITDENADFGHNFSSFNVADISGVFIPRKPTNRLPRRQPTAQCPKCPKTWHHPTEWIFPKVLPRLTARTLTKVQDHQGRKSKVMSLPPLLMPKKKTEFHPANAPQAAMAAGEINPAALGVWAKNRRRKAQISSSAAAL